MSTHGYIHGYPYPRQPWDRVAELSLCIVHCNVYCCIIMLYNIASSFSRLVDIIVWIIFFTFFLYPFEIQFSWCWSLICQQTIFPSVLWHCQLGYVACKIVPEMAYYVLGGTLNLIHSLTGRSCFRHKSRVGHGELYSTGVHHWIDRENCHWQDRGFNAPSIN